MNEQEPTLLSEDFDTSADILEFAKAFPKAQAAMGEVLKNANNPAFKSKYADLGAVVEATIPALNSAGFSVLQPPSCSGADVKVATLILHESGQWMRCTLTLRPTKTDPQGVGSAITYGRRYGLQAMTGVAPADDDGNAASRPRDDHRPDPRDEPASKPRPDAAISAAKGAIDMCGDEGVMNLWLKDNGPNLLKLKSDHLDAYAEVMAHAEGRRKEFREVADPFSEAA